MSEKDADYLFALDLHKRLNSQNDDDDIPEVFDVMPKAPMKRPSTKKSLPVKRSNPHSNLDEDFLNRTQNLVHPLWETLDPTPDVHALFKAFDDKFFQTRLRCVTLEWSKRMYSCAGICYSRRNRFGMDVTVRLSEPLLKLRPRKDLVETLLHEMIHAYCFVLRIVEGNGGHGPVFKKIMYGINKVAGTNITVYHTFHDEVELYKQHWWRCNGVCQHRSPFFGYVKRSSNRAPSANDQWWAQHQYSCGGTFMKIKGPDSDKNTKLSIKDKKQNKIRNGQDLRKFFTTGTNNNQENNKPTNRIGNNVHGISNIVGNSFKNGTKTNGGGTMLINPKKKLPNTNSSIAAQFPPTSYPGLSTDPFNTQSQDANKRLKRSNTIAGNMNNVKSLRDLNSSSSAGGNGADGVKSFSVSMSGSGYSLTSKNDKTSDTNNKPVLDRNKVRELWSKRFSNKNDEDSAKEPKKQKTDEENCRNIPKNDATQLNESNDINWVVVDDDVMLHETQIDVIDLSSDEDDEGAHEIISINDNVSDRNDIMQQLVPRFKQEKLSADERQNVIRREILDETAGLLDEDIILIDDEYDDDINDDDPAVSIAAELADTSIIDEFFGEDSLLRNYELENAVVPSGSRYTHKPDDDIITCPICQAKMKRNLLAEHLDGCGGISTKIELNIPTSKRGGSSRYPNQKRPPRSGAAKTSKQPSSSSSSSSQSNRSSITKNDHRTLRFAGYSEEEINQISNQASDQSLQPEAIVDVNDSSDDSFRSYRARSLYKTTRQCPICAKEIEESEINDHIDECFKNF